MSTLATIGRGVVLVAWLVGAAWTGFRLRRRVRAEEGRRLARCLARSDWMHTGRRPPKETW